MKILVFTALVMAATALPQFSENRPIAIIRYSQQQDPAGFYSYSFDTENGISVREEGTVTKPGSNDESTAKRGAFSYPGDDGQQYTLEWIADENGFQASGAHLPTPPPIPEAIQRSLEENANAGITFDERGFPTNQK